MAPSLILPSILSPMHVVKAANIDERHYTAFRFRKYYMGAGKKPLMVTITVMRIKIQDGQVMRLLLQKRSQNGYVWSTLSLERLKGLKFIGKEQM